MSAFNPTPAEIALTSQVFAVADPQKLGIVTGDTAVKILSGANLSHTVLGEVWAIADKENNGFLTKKGVAIALRLIGYAQKGEAVTETLLDKPGPLAYVDGVSKPVPTRSPAPSSPDPQSPHSNSGSILPPLTQQDKTKFLKLFIGCGPVNGLLSGEKARDVFVKSKLPYDKLSHIWTLADTKTRGALESTDFTIGMYLIQASMSSPSLLLPATLPSWIYDQAAQSLDLNATVASHATGGNASALGSPLQSTFQVPRQYTGSGISALGPSTVKSQYTGQQLPQTPTRQTTSGFTRSSASPPVAATHNNTRPLGQPWGVSAETKASSDQFFDGLDSQRRGYIEGDIAVPFMLESKLPESELAQIWDLADLRNDGRLTREGFAVAMHIIHSRLAGNEIPSTLPPSLVPPSLRQSSTISATAEPQLDLLLDDTPPASAVQPQQTGESGHVPTTMSRPAPLGHGLGQDSFLPSSQSRFPPISQPRDSPAFTRVTNKDLLGDDDDDASKDDSLPDNSAEIGNLQNQVSSTTRSLEATQTERASTEQIVTQQALQLLQLQTQLSSARASYETESQLLTTLRERLATQRMDIQKTREELISAESELSATKVEKAEVEGSVLRDKEEVRDLQRRMKEVGAQTDALKVGIEKAKRDARQQKGLLAIAKKQLATAETEKLKANKELEVVQKELEVVQKEKDAVDSRVSELDAATSTNVPGDLTHVDRVVSPAPSAFAAAIPLPDTPQPTTPQPSASRQSTNPFERLALVSMGADSGITFKALTPPNGEVSLPESSDLFGFSSPAVVGTPRAQPFTAVADTSEATKPGISTTTSSAGFASPVSAISPSDNDAPFLTPPSTANPVDEEHDGVNARLDQERTFSGVYSLGVQDDGLLSPLREIENDDSESSDNDDEPLGTKLPVPRKNEQMPSGRASPAIAAKLSNNSPVGLEPSSASNPTFDDTFGATSHQASASAPAKASPTISGKSSPRRSRSPERALSTRTLSSHSIGAAMDPFGASVFSQTPLEPPAGEPAPPPTIETVLEPSVGPPNASSINDFDEALGKLPSSTKDGSSAFKFDSTFDDNFDFPSIVNGATSGKDGQISSLSPNGTLDTPTPNLAMAATTFPPVSAPLTPPIPVEAMSRSTNSPPATEMDVTPFGSPFPHTISPAPANSGPVVSFDDAFGLNSSVNVNSNGQHSTANGTGPTFDVFGAPSQEPAVPTSTGNPFPYTPPSKPASAEIQSSPPPARSASPPIRPASPRQPRVSVGTSRTTSPPPRASSPRLRALSGSKASSSENKSEAPSKHKLSIRFPFGRKDKSKDKEEKRGHQGHQQLPEPQQFLSPVSEPPLPGTVTPAVEDDAEPVKQLAAMGFSRTQSIAALETHGYDMQRALNSLLGAA